MRLSLQLLLCLIGLFIPAARALAASGCSPEWSYTSATRNHIVSIVTGTDTASVAKRTAYNLPQVLATDVGFVVDSAICAQAGAALASVVATEHGTSGKALWVLRVGPTRYVVFDGKQKAGEFDNYYVFDASFTILLVISG